MLFRVHPVCLAEEKKMGLDFGEDVYDASAYGDIMDLMVASDTLVTDYSSTSFEFSLSGKPCWLLFDDYEQYSRSTKIIVDVQREVLFDKCGDLPALVDAIERFDEDLYRENMRKMHAQFGSYEKGEACAYVAQRIVQHLESNK